MTSRTLIQVCVAILATLFAGNTTLASEALQSTLHTHETFAAYIHGMHALNASVDYVLQPWGYDGTAQIRSNGMIGWFVHMNVIAHTEGRFSTGNTVAPILYDSAGLSRGAQRHVHLDYRNGTPDVSVRTPEETDREPVPKTQLPGSIDTFSGMMQLLKAIRENGQCNGSARIFDGIRLTSLTVHGPVSDNIPDNHGQAETGKALRCDFVGQQIAGFVRNSPNRAKMAIPKPGSAWFKKIDGFGLIPVRIEFEHPKFGHISLVLQDPITP